METPTFTLTELASLTGGTVEGDGDLTVTGAASLAEATEDEISFFGDTRYLSLLRNTKARAVFVPEEFTEKIGPVAIRVAEPARAFEQVVLQLAPAPIRFAPGIHPTAIISPEATLDGDVSIQPHAVVERGATIGDGSVIGANSYIGHDTRLGEGCLIYPNVTIRERTRIGRRVIIHSGAVIGSDGFGFEEREGKQEKIPQLGMVQIDDDVEIGSNTTIDRARFGRTWIQAGAKIDNLVQVAHNVVIGKNSMVAAQAGIAGSVRIGQRVLIGGQVGIIGHIEIGDDTRIGAQTGVSKNLSGGTWWATPSEPLEDALKHLAFVRRLGKLFERVKALEKKVAE